MVQWLTAGVSNTGSTDSNGNFAFEIPLAAAVQVEISTIANLYDPTQTSVQLQPGVNPLLTIPLVHKTSGQFGAVTGSVRTTSGQTIPNATVSILGAGDYLTTTTNSSGRYQFTHLGFNSNLTLQAATANSPCIVTTQVPLDMNATRVTASVQAQGVLTIAANCPPPQESPAGGDRAQFRPQISIDDTVQWEQADQFSVVSPGAPNAWNAGRINDILRFPPGQGLLVASDEGGVWSIAEDANRTATPLSNKWTVNGALGVLSITNGPVSGNNCLARLKASPGPVSVIYGLSASDPAGFNISHPVATFGATPPGSCPQ
jgi:hypothetical protein